MNTFLNIEEAKVTSEKQVTLLGIKIDEKNYLKINSLNSVENQAINSMQ